MHGERNAGTTSIPQTLSSGNRPARGAGRSDGGSRQREPGSATKNRTPLLYPAGESSLQASNRTRACHSATHDGMAAGESSLQASRETRPLPGRSPAHGIRDRRAVSHPPARFLPGPSGDVPDCLIWSRPGDQGCVQPCRSRLPYLTRQSRGRQISRPGRPRNRCRRPTRWCRSGPGRGRPPTGHR